MRLRRIETSFRHVGAALLALCAGLASAQQPRAQDFASGNYWVIECSQEIAPECAAYLQGMNDFHNEPAVPALYCIPKGVTKRQMRDVVVRHLRDNPARLHLPFARLAVDAFKAAWPCP